MKKRILFPLILLLFVLFTHSVSAFSFSDLLKPITNLLSDNDSNKNNFTLKSELKLAQGGDYNQNNQIDAGDTITFIYNINNPTNNEFAFATLKTNIPRTSLNFIHNIQGTVNLSDKNGTITIPNLRINPGQELVISFDARINYFTETDSIIST